MSRILIAYATGEGQTDKIAVALSEQLILLEHTVHLANLGGIDVSPDPSHYDAVIVAASVHAGRHQASALRFVQRHREALAGTTTAFLSVSMSAAASTSAGRREAGRQAEAFLEEAGWRPLQVETVAGALRYSQLSWLKRLWVRLAQTLFRKDLNRLGWPEDLTRDTEFTNWGGLRRFGDHFSATLAAQARRPGHRPADAAD